MVYVLWFLGDGKQNDPHHGTKAGFYILALFECKQPGQCSKPLIIPLYHSTGWSRKGFSWIIQIIHHHSQPPQPIIINLSYAAVPMLLDCDQWPSIDHETNSHIKYILGFINQRFSNHVLYVVLTTGTP